MIWMIVVGAMACVTAFVVVICTMLPPPAPCDDCGQELGSNNDCENCVDFRILP
ncbi:MULTISPECIES: hypothetical protein [unclassified Sphingobium]|uniref:hypothetical protein n=1 Tax=unclassified Sphingobium TaxID=2611147 RepID=UPI00222577AF|nr:MULTISPECIES: hypothetical protein [unclassified Sphingobium]MCW2412040.1 hypothetical protein [Sphingobium sp. B8D3D]MCW2415663.1 hypothetical protein [Sphingobium sp. B8D3A]